MNQEVFVCQALNKLANPIDKVKKRIEPRTTLGIFR